MKDSLSKDWVWRIVTPVLVGIALVVMWEAICRGFQIPDYLFPAPTSVAASFRENLPLLLISLQSTALVALKAFLLAILLGTLASFLFVESRFAEIGLFPYVVLLQVTPIVAIAVYSSFACVAEPKPRLKRSGMSWPTTSCGCETWSVRCAG